MANQMTLPPIDPAARIAAYPDLARLIEHCRELAGGHELPHRKDFRASQVRGMIAHLYLVDVVDGGADYRCRLWGQFWEAIFGISLLGKRLSDLERTGNVMHLRTEYDLAVANRQIQFRIGRVVWPDHVTVELARVIIPFCSDDGRVSMLLCAATSDKPIEDILFFKGVGVPSFAYEDEVMIEPAAPGLAAAEGHFDEGDPAIRSS
jgi:hypothetical protein